jgi:hypothetical protein
MRAWYGGRAPLDPDTWAAILAVESDPVVFYDHLGGGGEGAALIRDLYNAMDSLKRNPAELRSWSDEDGMETFYEVLIDFAPEDLRGRLQVLQRLGSLRFRKSETPDERKAKVAAAFAVVGPEDDYADYLRQQARRLAQVWSPRPESLLDFAIARPAHLGRQLSERLNPVSTRPLRLIAHRFTEVRRDVLEPLVATKMVAFECEAEIHFVDPLRPVLERWDEDAQASGCSRVSLFQALLLHELTELLLHENEPGLEPLDAHIVAGVFERYLKGQTLSVAVDDFFLDWPPLSSAEIAEREAAEMAEQLAEMHAFMGGPAAPVDDDIDVDALPVDGGSANPKARGAATKRAPGKPGTKPGGKGRS